MLDIIYIVLAILVIGIFAKYITYILSFVSLLPSSITNLLLFALAVQLILLVIGRRKSS